MQVLEPVGTIVFQAAVVSQLADLQVFLVAAAVAPSHMVADAAGVTMVQAV